MDLNSIAQFAKEYLVDHWPFIIVSLALGMIGVFAKRYVWLKEKAAKSRFHYWMRATLPFHPVVAGAVFGFGGELLFNGQMVVGPGIERTPAAIAMYYAGAGLLSTWLWSAFKTFLKARGISAEEVDMPSRYPQIVKAAISEPPKPAPEPPEAG